MAIKKGFDKHELDVINGRLRTLYRVAEDQLPKVLKEVVEDIKKDVINSAPIQTGNLRNSVYTGRYKTTNYWYDNVKRNLGKLDHKLKQMLAKAAINKK